MSKLDIINAAFEGWGAVMIWLNFRRLLRDREVKGVDWRVTAFYSTWGLWNLVYYSGVGHWLSCAMCVGITAGNIAWVVLALRLLHKPSFRTCCPGCGEFDSMYGPGGSCWFCYPEKTSGAFRREIENPPPPARRGVS